MNEPITIIITGRPFSKKNSRQSRKARSKTGNLYTYMAPGANYELFKQSALYQLKAYKVHFPKYVRIDYLFYRKGQEYQDIDNAMASINDVLEDAGILANDRYVKTGSFDFIQGQKEWSTMLRIQSIAIE